MKSRKPGDMMSSYKKSGVFPRKAMKLTKAQFEKADKPLDKALGIKEGSPKDIKMDKYLMSLAKKSKKKPMSKAEMMAMKKKSAKKSVKHKRVMLGEEKGSMHLKKAPKKMKRISTGVSAKGMARSKKKPSKKSKAAC